MDSFWPSPARIWYSSPDATPVPTPPEEKYAKEAYRRWMALLSPQARGVSASIQFYLYRMVGRRHAVEGLERFWRMMGEERLNRALFVGLLEAVTRVLLEQDRRRFV
jgi:hypothetical protein